MKKNGLRFLVIFDYRSSPLAKFLFCLDLCLLGWLIGLPVNWRIIKYRIHSSLPPARIQRATAQEEVFIESAMKALYAPVAEDVRVIVRVKDLGLGDGGFHTSIPVEIFNEQLGGLVLIGDRNVNKNTLWHEAMHAHAAGLPEEALIELVSITGRWGYAGEDWVNRNPNNYPSKGFVSIYGRHNPNEDIATLGAEAYCYLNGEPSAFDRKFDKGNHAWRELFDWLLRWEFIDAPRHAKLVKMLGS